MTAAAPELVRAVLDMPSTAYAVVDGAHFDDVLMSLAASDIPARSLFINRRSPGAVRAGPFLAEIRTRAAREALFQFLGDKPAAVFWSCSQGESILFRHLRTINMVSIPSAIKDEETVLFRHYDPLVLTLVIPLLNDQQFARVIGPTEDIVMFAPDSGLRHVRRPADLPTPRAGLLQVSAEQIAGIEDGMRKRSLLRIANYLREVAPEMTAAMADHVLFEFVRESEEVGRVLGLRTEQGFGRWACLMLMTKGQAATLRGVRTYIADGKAAPDQQVKSLMRLAARTMKTAETK
jgi:hypothetical protein